MPQMSPIWWSTMFTTFILTYIIIMMIMYFYKIYKMKSTKTYNENMMTNMFWKW